jgi:ArsR family transcriptional regulator
MYLFIFAVEFKLEEDMDSKRFEKISRALGDPHRLQILQKFKKKNDPLYCSEIHDMLDLAQPSVSHHLKQLVDADLLLPEKEGRNLKYNLNEEVINDYIAFLAALKG